MTTQEENPTKQEHKQITGTDISWLAEGYWRRYFNWRIYPVVRYFVLTATVSFFITFTLLLISGSYAAADSIPAVIPITMFIFLVVFLFSGTLAVVRFQGDRQDFIDDCVNRWEKGDPVLPGFDTVKRYTNSKRLKKQEER